LIVELILRGELDKTDLSIIAARDCSPMPSYRAVARQLKLISSTVLRRAHHIKRLLA